MCQACGFKQHADMACSVFKAQRMERTLPELLAQFGLQGGDAVLLGQAQAV